MFLNKFASCSIPYFNFFVDSLALASKLFTYMVSQVVFLLNILVFRLWVTIQPFNYFSLRNSKMFSFYNLFSLKLLATLGVTLKLEITEQIVLVDNAKKN